MLERRAPKQNSAGGPTEARRRPAAFLDRDGVLNLDKGFVHRVADFEWVPGAPEAIKYANERGLLVIVVTNQSGIARGLYREREMMALHRWIGEHLAARGARIDAFYHCPYHPEAKVERYRRHSELRKPAPGMILKAMHDWPIDASRSFLIGDEERDLVAAERAGIPGYLFSGGSLYDLVVACVSRHVQAAL